MRRDKGWLLGVVMGALLVCTCGGEDDPPGTGGAAGSAGSAAAGGSGADGGGGSSSIEAEFSGEPRTGTAPLGVQFTDASTGAIDAWAWDFDSDGAIDSTEQHPTHTYTESGLYSVTLMVTGPAGSDTETKETYIAAGPLYYVAKDGNDDNPGSEAEPWLTISLAASTLVAGETVYVKQGTYHEQVHVEHSGAVGSPIKFMAYPGDEVIVDGTGIDLPDWYGVFRISSLSHIRVSGFQVVNSDYAGIFIGDSSFVVVDHNHTVNTRSSGIASWGGDHIIIDGNEVELACNDSLGNECITVSGTDSFEVKNNDVHHDGTGDFGGEGIDTKQGCTNGKVYGNHVHDLNEVGIYVDAWDQHTHDIEVFQNVVHDCSPGMAAASENGGLLERVRFFNNVGYDNDGAGFVLGHWGPAPGSTHDIAVVNNTFTRNSGCVLLTPDTLSVIDNIVVRNNVCSQNGNFEIGAEPTLHGTVIVDHNLLDAFSGGWNWEITGTDHVSGSPGFVDPAQADFHITAGSPAVDNGSSVDAPTVDFDDNPRPAGSGYDIGAFELQL